MAVILDGDFPFHDGENRMHKLLHVPDTDNPTSPFLTPYAGSLLTQSPLVAVGAMDAQGRPWTTVFGSEPGFARPISQSVIRIRTLVDTAYDPVITALFAEKARTGEVVKSEGKERLLAALGIDLASRRRIKLAGRMLAGIVEPVDDNLGQATGSMQMAVEIDQSLGNCPKYLNKKHIRPSNFRPSLKASGVPLSEDAVQLIQKSDLFFLSSFHNKEDGDTNYRGGPPGFVRIVSNNLELTSIVYPEYSGNRLYQTLGNLTTNPQVGIVFPDFDNGNVLYVTGETEILIGDDAATLLPRSNLAVKIKIIDARFVSDGLNFRGTQDAFSPYNPPVRFLASERKPVPDQSTKHVDAALVEVIKLSPTISRYRFELPKGHGLEWKGGQYVTLDFAEELSIGYSHMRDSDPLSLNDDYIRTFTVSSSPAKLADCFEITCRLNGPVTRFLSRQHAKSGLSVPVRGFGGDFYISTPSADETIGFVAGGVGITPLLPQLSSLPVSRIRLLWSLNKDDLNFAADVLKTYPDLAKCTTIFVTGSGENTTGADRALKGLGVSFSKRRLTQADIPEIDVSVWYVCAGDVLRKALLSWLQGRQVVYEDFNY